MNPKLRILGVWSAAAFFLLWLISFVFFAQSIPPIPPSANANEVADLFQARSVPIRVGMVLMSFGTVFYLPWSMVLADLVKEIEGKSNFLSGTMLAAGVLCCVTFFLPAFLWATAAFRPERNPEITQALVDLGWLFFITPIAPFILQYTILAIITFGDKRPQPIYPRWAGYLQLWVSLSFLPSVIAIFLKTDRSRGTAFWCVESLRHLHRVVRDHDRADSSGCSAQRRTVTQVPVTGSVSTA